MAVFNRRVTVKHIDNCSCVISCKIIEFHIIESHIRLDEFDACTVGEIHFFDVTSSGVLKEHAELILLSAIEFHSITSMDTIH